MPLFYQRAAFRAGVNKLLAARRAYRAVARSFEADIHMAFRADPGVKGTHFIYPPSLIPHLSFFR